MSTSSYQILERYPARWYKGAPVHLAAAQLLLSSVNGRVYLQAKFKIHRVPTAALSIAVVCRDAFDKPLGETEAQYTEIDSRPYRYFGQDKAILLPDETRKIQIVLRQARYSDGRLWQGQDDLPSECIPEQSRLQFTDKQSDILNWYLQTNQPDKNLSYSIDFQPMEHADCWQCWCGRLCAREEKTCPDCGFALEQELHFIDPDFIEGQRAEYESQKKYEEAWTLVSYHDEKAHSRTAILDYNAAAALFSSIPDYKDAAELSEHYAALAQSLKSKLRKRKRAYITLVALAILAATLILLTVKLFIPLFQYNHGKSLREKGSYTEAIAVFTQLENFKDSPEQIIETQYQQAAALLAGGDYFNARNSFQNLGDYKDSQDQVKETYYQQGKAYMEAGDYTGAYGCFGTIRGYEGHDDIESLYKEACYRDGQRQMETQNYRTAVLCFEKCTDYQDAAEQLKEAKYQYVLGHMDPNYDTTNDYLADLKKEGYKDAAALYDQLQSMIKWTVKIAINNSAYDDTHQSKVSLDYLDDVHVHIQATCTKSNEDIRLKAVYTFDGETNTRTDFVPSGGEMGWYTYVSGYGRDPSGTYSVKVYNADTNELLASASSRVN